VASAFGASSSQTTFGARGATTLLEKITTWSFVGFSVLAVTISLMQARPKSTVIQSQKGAKAPAAAPAVPKPALPATGVPVTAPMQAAPAQPAPAAPAPAPATK
jgi:preprotein translocase subunit SecG